MCNILKRAGLAVVLQLFILHYQASAQKLRFQQLGVEQGLPASEVYNLFQDGQGYLWAFTQYGIVKHNGRQFIPACRNLSFDESIVYVVRRSAGGGMYIANSKGNIYCVKNDSATMVHAIRKASQKILKDKEVLFDMLIRSPSDMYFSTYRKSYHYTGKEVRLLTRPPGDTGIICFKKIEEDYIVTYQVKTDTPPKKSMIKIIDQQNRVVCQFLSAGNPYWDERNNIRESAGTYYVTGTQTLTRLHKNGTIKQITLDKLITIETSKDGHIWAGTGNGLYELDTGLQVLNHYFEDILVSDILFDRNNGLWVSTIGQGLFYARNIHALFYDNIRELSQDITLLKKIDDHLFIGTSKGLLFEKTHEGINSISINTPFSLTDMTLDHNEYLVGTKGDMIRLDKRLLANKGPLLINGAVSNSYGFIRPGNDTLVLITGSAIIKLRAADHTFISGVRITDAKPNSIAKRGTHTYFIGTLKGLFLLGDSLTCPPYLWPLRDVQIRRLKTDNRNNLWICTKGHGLYLLHPDNLLEQVKNAPSNVVNDIDLEDDSILLLATNKGLYLHRGAYKDSLSELTCLLSNEASFSTVFNNHIYVATQQGLIALSQDRIFTHSTPGFYLASVTANGRTVGPDSILHFSHNENDLYFNFDFLLYGEPGYSFYYQLQGSGSGSNIISGTELHLKNLDPGHYMLSAYIMDQTGHVKDYSPVRISLYIEPAFWQTRLFIISVIMGSATLLFLLTWLSYRRLKRKEKYRASVIRELAGYRLTALKSQINPHFISNSLTAIQELVFNNEIRKANQYIANFSLLIRYALQYSDKMITSLAKEIRIIDAIVALEQLRFSSSFVFEKEIAAGMNTHEVFIPPLITQPIIENAIWHGLLPLNGKHPARLILKVYNENTDLVISIIDNGVGRQPPAEPKHDRESRGVGLITGWIDNLNKLFPANIAEIRFIDLRNERNKPGGTRVDIRLKQEALNKLYKEHETRLKNDQGHYY